MISSATAAPPNPNGQFKIGSGTVATTTGMATTGAIGMAIGTGIAAIVVLIFLDSAIDIDNAQTRLAGTFHLSNGSHSSLLRP